METIFEYYAFISYKHEDVKWAKWLQNKLISYKLPSFIRKETPRLPKRINPVFRDMTNFDADTLSENIKYGLEKSRYLIVLCSPRSAKSKYVGDEIAEFVKMGRTDHIIPFIVDGEPNCGDERECFHSVIKKEIPDMLAININEIGKRKAFIKLVAKLLDIRFDKIWTLEKERQLKQRIIAAVAGFLFLVGTGFVWDYNRTKKEYYADYVDKWGIPEGIIKLDKSKVKKRNSYYQFESRQGKLRRVVHANSAGMAVNHTNTEHTDRFAIQVLSYKDKDNRLNETELKNAQNKTIAIYSWGGNNFDSIDIRNTEGGSAAALASSFTSMLNLFEQNSNKADIKRFKLTRNNDGYIIRKEFKQHNGDDKFPACDASGIWGFEYDIDDLGRPEKLYYLGYANGKYYPSMDKIGVMGRRYEYDKYGNISRAEYFGKDNKLILNEHLWAIGLDVSDNNGNIIESSFWGIDGALCLHKDGVAKVTAKYNKRGNRIEEAYSGIDGAPCLYKDGFAKVTVKYDKRGNMSEQSYFGIDGNPCFQDEGFAKWRAKYDKPGNMIRVAYFGIDDNLCLHKDGFAVLAMKYDEHGNRTEETYFDIDVNLRKDKYAVLAMKYDEYGNITEEAYFGIDGNLCLHKDGFAELTMEYDEHGNRTEQAYFGTDGNPILIEGGFAKWVAKYDERGNATEIAYFGIDGYPLLTEYGYAKWTAEYDERGNMVKQACFGIDGNPCLQKEGFAKWTAEYNERGDMTEQVYFGVDDNPLLIEYGYAKITMEYDERGNRIEETYLGINGNPILHVGGYAKGTIKHDERGNIIELAFFGINGNPCLCDEGFAKWTMKYDQRGNRTEEAYFGIDGNSVLHKDGYARLTRIYLDSEYISDQKYYGVNNELLATSILYLTVPERGVAWQKGLQGKMLVLEYCDWEFGDTFYKMYTKTIPANYEEDQKFIILNMAGQIVQYDFGEEIMDVQLFAEEITGEEFYDIEKQYKEWKHGK